MTLMLTSIGLAAVIALQFGKRGSAGKDRDPSDE